MTIAVDLGRKATKQTNKITDELSIEANSVDPEQTAPKGAVCSGSTLFAIETS